MGMTNLEEVDPADEPRAYRSKGYLARMGVAVAGSVMHFIIALLLMFVVVWGAGDFRNGELRATLSGVEPGAPADIAGIEAGDTILEIDGVAIEEWQGVPDTVRPRGDRRSTSWWSATASGSRSRSPSPRPTRRWPVRPATPVSAQLPTCRAPGCSGR
ncbi:MAG: PDZ domain-containing protein [Acidimicrobiia bacterium]|nr:PDZ domain-containing protein [Acidimicrobiia bacterium]